MFRKVGYYYNDCIHRRHVFSSWYCCASFHLAFSFIFNIKSLGVSLEESSCRNTCHVTVDYFLKNGRQSIYNKVYHQCICICCDLLRLILHLHIYKGFGAWFSPKHVFSNVEYSILTHPTAIGCWCKGRIWGKDWKFETHPGGTTAETSGNNEERIRAWSWYWGWTSYERPW